MKQAFITKKFNPQSQNTIRIVNQILDEYRALGYRLSLRQLYYQMVARDYIPNNLRSYKNLGNLVSEARQAGLVDWDMLEDRNRATTQNSHWSSPKSILYAAASSFAIDKWEDQPWHVEVMVEKDALSGVLEPVCRELDIPITANKGYSSSSTMYEIGQRLRRYRRAGKDILILYLGDHDPSGIDMTRDVDDRLDMYSHGSRVEVKRLALNMDQVERWQPPENPAKDSDARFAAYAAEFGDSCWELDAIEPTQLANLVRDAVLEVRDNDLWDAAVERQERQREFLQTTADNYEEEE